MAAPCDNQRGTCADYPVCQCGRAWKAREAVRRIDLTGEWGAVFSPCRLYRYRLWRIWDRAIAPAVFCLMNCSTADEVKDDPTVKRCCVRAMEWRKHGWLTVGGVIVVNAFAWRETDSRKLRGLVRSGTDIVGPDNDGHIIDACRNAAIVVCGWGQPGHHLLDRGRQLLAMFRQHAVRLHALGTNADGSPEHPLYISYKTQPREWL